MSLAGRRALSHTDSEPESPELSSLSDAILVNQPRSAEPHSTIPILAARGKNEDPPLIASPYQTSQRGPHLLSLTDLGTLSGGLG